MTHRVTTFSFLLLRIPISVHTRKEGVVISVSSLLLLFMSESMIPVRQKRLAHKNFGIKENR